jgi:hypothetical protein
VQAEPAQQRGAGRDDQQGQQVRRKPHLVLAVARQQAGQRGEQVEQRRVVRVRRRGVREPVGAEVRAEDALFLEVP